MTDEPIYFRTSHVYKRFGPKVALRDISITLPAGEIVALLGANGAGKTSLLRTLATLSRPTRGEVYAFGSDAWSARPEVRARIGVVAHQPYLYPELTCSENLRFFARMYDVANAAIRVQESLEQVGLSKRADDRAATLSRGLLQRLNLARATLHLPAVLILDEPDTGLDATGRAVLSDLVLAQTSGGGSVIITTHALDYALELATRVIVLTDGSVALDNQREALSDDAVVLAISGDALRSGR